MSKTEEKAKTFYELGKEWMEMKVDDTRNEEKWVRLEVAQQEIDNLKTLNDFLNTENLATMKDFCELKKERGEQKKKMNSIFPELDLEDKWHVNPMMNRIREIIKELLKE